MDSITPLQHISVRQYIREYVELKLCHDREYHPVQALSYCSKKFTHQSEETTDERVGIGSDAG